MPERSVIEVRIRALKGIRLVIHVDGSPVEFNKSIDMLGDR